MTEEKQIEDRKLIEHKAVPKLRFREFDDEWEFKKFGEITTKVGSGSTPKGGSNVYQQKGIPFIRSQNVIQNQLILDNTFISEEINKKMKGSIVRPNDVLLNITGASIGRSCLVPNDFKCGNVNQHVCIIRLKNNYAPKFIQVFLSSEKGQRLVDQGQTGSGREGLNFQSIRLFKSRFPSLPEQQKIASFLSAVDKKIQQLTRKKELLETYKKGVMQKLFSQEIRFKPAQSGAEGNDNGKDFLAWQTKRLGEIFTITAGGDIKKGNVSKLRTAQFRYPVYANSDKNKGLYGYSDIYKIDYDCVTVTGRGALGIANARVEKFYPIVRLLVLKPKQKGNVIFYENLINSFNFFIESTGVPQLTAPQISIYKMKIPCFEEQQKIADFLAAIDKKIEAVSQQIEKTQCFKKGLLQQMFV